MVLKRPLSSHMACIQTDETEPSRKQLKEGLGLCCVACAFQIAVLQYAFCCHLIYCHKSSTIYSQGNKRNIAISNSNLKSSITFTLAQLYLN